MKHDNNIPEGISKAHYDELMFSSSVANSATSFDPEKGFNHFIHRTRSANRRIRIQFWGCRIAAMIAVVFVCSVSFYMLGRSDVEKQFAEIVVEAPIGSQSKVSLPDGTTVWLNTGSKIAYSQGFGVENRDISMVGEAYFEVAKNTELPFKVNTKEISVRVVGTKFNFRNYLEDEEAVVTLIQGRVALKNNQKDESEKLLNPNEKMVFNKQTHNMHISEAKALNSKDWTNDNLFFDEYLISDIAKELERNYDVKIKIADDALKGLRFYASFNRRNRSLIEVLDVLTATNLVKYKIEGDIIYLYCN